MNEHKFKYAWLTDIDDTLIGSGVFPDDKWINSLSSKLRILKENKVVWVPVSGVDINKLGSRILYRLSPEVLDNIIYYGGDGSEKYYYNSETKKWDSDFVFQSVFTDAQASALIGLDNYINELCERREISPFLPDIIERKEQIEKLLKANEMKPDFSILDFLKQILSESGYNPDESEVYFRGGSVSWMIFGDISAEAYKTDRALKTRKKLFSAAVEFLESHQSLSQLGRYMVHIPFSGARGIKFVLKGNNKERCIRNLIKEEKLLPENMIFIGNELFDGGNDNMIRNIKGVTLISVGEKTDPGENIFFIGEGVDTNTNLMDSACKILVNGGDFGAVIRSIKEKYISLNQE